MTSTRPGWAQRLVALLNSVAADPSLSEQFDAGLTDIAARTRHTELQRAIDDFLADHGHRCNDEYELASPAWAMDPTPVYAAIDRLRLVPDDPDPVVAARRLADDATVALQEAVQVLPRRLHWMTRTERRGG